MATVRAPGRHGPAEVQLKCVFPQHTLLPQILSTTRKLSGLGINHRTLLLQREGERGRERERERIRFIGYHDLTEKYC